MIHKDYDPNSIGYTGPARIENSGFVVDDDYVKAKENSIYRYTSYPSSGKYKLDCSIEMGKNSRGIFGLSSNVLQRIDEGIFIHVGDSCFLDLPSIQRDLKIEGEDFCKVSLRSNSRIKKIVGGSFIITDMNYSIVVQSFSKDIVITFEGGHSVVIPEGVACSLHNSGTPSMNKRSIKRAVLNRLQMVKSYE